MKSLRSLRGYAALCLIGTLQLFVAPLAAGQNDNQEEGVIVPREGWVISGGRGSRGRVALPTDELEWAWINGELKLPATNQDESPSGPDLAPWRKVTGDENGNFSDRALRNGWLLTYVEAPQEQVYLLQASGHGSVIVNGERRGGDIYSDGFVHLPVLLKKGQNTLIFQRARGSIGIRLRPATQSTFISLADTTTPDVIRQEREELWCGVLVVNASTDTVDTLRIETSGGGFATESNVVPSMPPLSVRKVPIRIVPDQDTSATLDDAEAIAIELRLSHKDQLVEKQEIQLSVRDVTETHRRTFVSEIDGSVQYYAVVPPVEGSLKDEARPSLVLTLHGAGVEGQGQANAYAPKPNTYIVAATNRRKFGFDWEDWGRWDAMEVLALASERFNADPRRTYLTGHSMGGHGTWHNGSLFPDRFAAIGPSAGWISFTTYIGGPRRPSGDDETVLDEKEQLLTGAAIGSDTLARVDNLQYPGVYILHGDADDNVPVGQARRMREELGAFHPDFVYKEQRGAGHWWGNRCVDWPPMFRFFEDHELPFARDVRDLKFVTPSPVISADCYWATVHAQFHSGNTSRLDLRYDPSARKIVGSTENVRRLKIDLAKLQDEGDESTSASKLELEIDDQEAWTIETEDNRELWLERGTDGWQQVLPPSTDDKGPHRGGFFKEAFNHRFVLVYGTGGSAEENSWMLSRARFDAESFWYRGNGSVDVVSDQAWKDVATGDRSVIVYGNAAINSAWQELIGDGPIQIRANEWKSTHSEPKQESVCVWMIRPRPGSDIASVGAIGGTDLRSMHASDRAPFFSSGTGYPDVLIVTPNYLQEGSAAVRWGGYFDVDWSLEGGAWVGESGPEPSSK